MVILTVQRSAGPPWRPTKSSLNLGRGRSRYFSHLSILWRQFVRTSSAWLGLIDVELHKSPAGLSCGGLCHQPN